ncbi:MAG TPA: hypothetical protein EYQ50_00630 [Verrucomicrobiales bacterium]|nr:hypothetical protein [Verrucomicrobiales bacterium]
MNRSDIEVRRANADDLSCLSSLWEKDHLDTVDLSKRFIEFQILMGFDDRLLRVSCRSQPGFPTQRLH